MHFANCSRATEIHTISVKVSRTTERNMISVTVDARPEPLDSAKLKEVMLISLDSNLVIYLHL